MDEHRKFSRRENYRYICENKDLICADAEKNGVKPTADKWKLTAHDVYLSLYFSGKYDKIGPATLEQLKKTRYEIMEEKKEESKKYEGNGRNGDQKAKYKETIQDPSFADYDLAVFELNGKNEYVVPKSKIGYYIDGKPFVISGTNSIRWDNYLVLSEQLGKENKQFKPIVTQGTNGAIKDYIKSSLKTT